jgi:hypothetical protein
MKATTRQDKSSIVTKIYDEVRLQASKPSGGFVKKVSNTSALQYNPFRLQRADFLS